MKCQYHVAPSCYLVLLFLSSFASLPHRFCSRPSWFSGPDHSTPDESDSVELSVLSSIMMTRLWGVTGEEYMLRIIVNLGVCINPLKLYVHFYTVIFDLSQYHQGSRSKRLCSWPCRFVPTLTINYAEKKFFWQCWWSVCTLVVCIPTLGVIFLALDFLQLFPIFMKFYRTRLWRLRLSFTVWSLFSNGFVQHPWRYGGHQCLHLPW